MATVGSEANVDRVLEDWERHLNAHDAARFVTLFTDDVVYEDVTFGAVNHGKAETQAFIESFFPAFPDLAFEVTSRFAAGDRAGLEWVMTGTHRGDLPGLPASGKRCNVRGATIIELAGGKIRRNSDYWDLATMLKQLGFMPAE